MKLRQNSSLGLDLPNEAAEREERRSFLLLTTNCSLPYLGH